MMYGPCRDPQTGEWRKSHNDGPCDMCVQPTGYSKRDKMKKIVRDRSRVEEI